MSISKKFYSLVVAGLLAFSSASHATNSLGPTTVYDFGNLLTASYAAPDSFASMPFAQLAATDTGHGVWSFLLTINNNLFSSFGPNAFIKTLSFDFSPNPTVQPVSLIGSTGGAGVAFVESGNGTGGSSSGVNFDFGTSFGQGNKEDRLSGSEWVQWTVSGLAADSRLNQMILHVQGITGDNSAKYTPIVSPVPEPETYAMLLAGLGLIGFSIRRSKQNK